MTTGKRWQRGQSVAVAVVTDGRSRRSFSRDKYSGDKYLVPWAVANANTRHISGFLRLAKKLLHPDVASHLPLQKWLEMPPL